MNELREQKMASDHGSDRSGVRTASTDADESGALAIGLMVAIVCLVALMTLALVISIP